MDSLLDDYFEQASTMQVATPITTPRKRKLLTSSAGRGDTLRRRGRSTSSHPRAR